MKKILIILTLLFSTIILQVFAENEISVFINGWYIDTDVPPIIKNDRTLVPVRAVSEALGYEVIWSEDTKQVVISNGGNSVILKIDSEKYLLNSEEKTLDAPARIVNDRTMVPLSLIMDCFGYETVWDESERRVDVYMRYESEYKDDGFKTLVDLSIIEEADINKSENISVKEALETIAKATLQYGETTIRLSDWYRRDELQPLDYLDDEIKKLVLNLDEMVIEDILATDFEGDFTEFEAVKYAVRMVNDTYGCVHVAGEPMFDDISQYYELAYIKGIIEKTDMADANKPISRKDFYEIINKTIYVEYSSGGYGGVSTVRIIDRHEIEPTVTAEPKEKEMIKLDIAPVFSDDMSVSWEFPEEYSFLEGDEYWTNIEGYNGDKLLSNSSMTIRKKGIETEELIEAYSWEKDRPEYYRITYYKYKENKEYYFDLYIPDIKVEYMDYTLTPGAYTHSKGQWPPKTISLSGEDTFKKDMYYILVSKENKYRVEKYNSKSHWVFKVEEEGNTFINTRGGAIGGTIHTDEIRIREVRVEGNVKDGFIICMTPDSEMFEILETE